MSRNGKGMKRWGLWVTAGSDRGLLPVSWCPASSTHEWRAKFLLSPHWTKPKISSSGSLSATREVTVLWVRSATLYDLCGGLRVKSAKWLSQALHIPHESQGSWLTLFAIKTSVSSAWASPGERPPLLHFHHWGTDLPSSYWSAVL